MCMCIFCVYVIKRNREMWREKKENGERFQRKEKKENLKMKRKYIVREG